MSEYEAGRETDALVAERVMGWESFGVSNWVDRETNTVHPNFKPSKLISAAWAVVEKMRDAWLPSVYHDGQLWVCEFYDGIRKVVASADTPMLAICRAALKAIEQKGDK